MIGRQKKVQTDQTWATDTCLGTPGGLNEFLVGEPLARPRLKIRVYGRGSKGHYVWIQTQARVKFCLCGPPHNLSVRCTVTVFFNTTWPTTTMAHQNL